MSNADHRIEDLFHDALKFKSPVERNDFLEQSCFNDPDLRTQVDQLLQAHDKAGQFLEQPPELPTLPPAEVAETELTLPPKKFNENDIRIDNQLPCTFGDYELLEEIAHGGMGVVFKARQVSLNRIVAIKMILAGQLAGKDEIRRFRIEAEAAGKLDHSGIVPVFDVGCHQGRHYFSMAFVEGSSLSARIKEGPLPPREAAVMARKIAVAMQVAHEGGVVHRDLKPGNVP